MKSFLKLGFVALITTALGACQGCATNQHTTELTDTNKRNSSAIDSIKNVKTQADSIQIKRDSTAKNN